MAQDETMEEKALPEKFRPDLEKHQSLKIIPLGGLGEFGANMMAYRYEDEIIVVDCGSMFPDPSLMGVDYVIPDMQYLKDNREKIKGLILTHGHEDHIGATPYFLRDTPAPVYGTPYTIELLKAKLKEHELGEGSCELNVIRPGESIDFEHFQVMFLHVNHSTCQSVSLAIDTPEGLLVHTGDFRIDTNPADGCVFDYAGFSALGFRGVLALLSDSTNIERPGFARSEADVTDQLQKMCCVLEGRIFVTLFSSSIPRIQTVCNLARAHGRKVHIAGRSLLTSTSIARSMGLLQVEDSMLIDVKQVDLLPPEKVLVILTGSQGEPRSVLTRVAMDDHKDIHINKGDVVIFSARVIPGHGRSVYKLVNHLAMRGARIYYEHNAGVHTSGHGHAGELATMLNLTRPKYFIPLHGEYHQLRSHGELAVSCGVDPAHVLLSLNGDVVQFHEGRGIPVDRVTTGRIFVDGKGVGEVGPDEIRERRKIGMTGVVIAILIIRPSTGEVLFGPELFSKGFIFEGVSEALFKDGKRKVLHELEELSQDAISDLEMVKEKMRLSLRRHFNHTLERKPVVIPIVMAM